MSYFLLYTSSKGFPWGKKSLYYTKFLAWCSWGEKNSTWHNLTVDDAKREVFLNIWFEFHTMSIEFDLCSSLMALWKESAVKCDFELQFSKFSIGFLYLLLFSKPGQYTLPADITLLQNLQVLLIWHSVSDRKRFDFRIHVYFTN